MSETQADIGYGAKFGIGDGADPEVFSDVAEVTSINGFGFTRAEQDATHLQSPDGFEEYIAGMKSGRPVTITMNYVPTDNDVIVTAFEAKKGNYQITAPNGVMMRFAGFVTEYDTGEMNTEKMTATATFRPTGKPTLHEAE